MHLTQVDVNLTATQQTVGEPWIWKLCRDFNVKVIIKKATVDEDCGWMQITLEGEVEEIQRSTAWLMTTGLHVEAQQRAVGA